VRGKNTFHAKPPTRKKDLLLEGTVPAVGGRKLPETAAK
jgi:hypothetical protein